MVVDLDEGRFEPAVSLLAFCYQFARRREGATSRGAGSYGVEDFARPVGQPLREISSRLGGPQHCVVHRRLFFLDRVRVIRVVVTLDTSAYPERSDGPSALKLPLG